MNRFLRISTVLAFSWALALTTWALPARAIGGQWVVKVVPYSKFDAGATTDTFTLYTTHGFESIQCVIMRRDVDFSGGAISAYTISVGKSGSVTKYQSATNVFTGATTGDTNSTVTTGPGAEADGTAIIATATSTTANVSAATAGQVTFWILVSSLPPR